MKKANIFLIISFKSYKERKNKKANIFLTVSLTATKTRKKEKERKK